MYVRWDSRGFFHTTSYKGELSYSRGREIFKESLASLEDGITRRRPKFFLDLRMSLLCRRHLSSGLRSREPIVHQYCTKTLTSYLKHPFAVLVASWRHNMWELCRLKELLLLESILFHSSVQLRTRVRKLRSEQQQGTIYVFSPLSAEEMKHRELCFGLRFQLIYLFVSSFAYTCIINHT